MLYSGKKKKKKIGEATFCMRDKENVISEIYGNIPTNLFNTVDAR